MRVITIGAGFSGILAAYQIQKQTQNVELAVYEKNADLGGTWLENRFPGTNRSSFYSTLSEVMRLIELFHRMRMRQPIPRIHVQLCAESRLAAFSRRSIGILQLSREGSKGVRFAQVHDVQY